MAADPLVADYAAEADETRERIAATIDELQDRLNPRRIAGDAIDKVQTQGAEMLTQARDAVRAHPLALAAVGTAVGLALLTRSKLANAKVNLGDDFERYTDYDDGLAEEAAAPPVYMSAPQPAAVRNTDRIAANPLVSILAGLAAGALIGMLVPATDGETKLIESLRRP